MHRINLSLIEQKLPEAEYRNHINVLEADPAGSEQRYMAWFNSYDTSLMSEFIRRLKNRDRFTISHGYIDWCRQQFIIFDCNRVNAQKIADDDRKIADEINAMLGM